MRRCHSCGKILEEVPGTCRQCGHTFCPEHLLPEKHLCPRLRQYDQAPHLRVCRQCGRELKGKILPCPWCGKVLCDSCRQPENHFCRSKFLSTG